MSPSALQVIIWAVLSAVSNGSTCSQPHLVEIVQAVRPMRIFILVESYMSAFVCTLQCFSERSNAMELMEPVLRDGQVHGLSRSLRPQIIHADDSILHDFAGLLVCFQCYGACSLHSSILPKPIEVVGNCHVLRIESIGSLYVLLLVIRTERQDEKSQQTQLEHHQDHVHDRQSPDSVQPPVSDAVKFRRAKFVVRTVHGLCDRVFVSKRLIRHDPNLRV